MLWERDTFKNQDQDEDKYQNLNEVTSVCGMPRNIRRDIKEPVSMGKWSCNMSSSYCLACVIAAEPESVTWTDMNTRKEWVSNLDRYEYEDS